MNLVSAFQVSRGGDGTESNLKHQTGCFSGAYSIFLGHAVEINIGGHYDPVRCHWYPPPETKLVEISGMIWFRDTFAPRSATQPDSACIKVFKTSLTRGLVELKAGPGWAGGGFPNTGGAALPTFSDIYEEGDAYGLFVLGTSKNYDIVNGVPVPRHDVVVDGHHAHSWWCGKAFGL
jgi:hypothetical protein